MYVRFYTKFKLSIEDEALANIKNILSKNKKKRKKKYILYKFLARVEDSIPLLL